MNSARGLILASFSACSAPKLRKNASGRRVFIYPLPIVARPKIGDQISGAVRVDYGEKPTDCRKAAETLLKTLHTASDYAQSGICPAAPKQRLKMGKTANVRSSSYLRTAPRWAEETRVRLVAPAEKLTLTITGGPLCAIYNQGEYSYWKVNLSNGETGWMAEGDLNEYYLAPKK